MPIPQNKTELLDAIHKNYGKLRDELLEIPVKYSRKKEIPGNIKGTKIAVSNLVAYQIGWGNLVLKWYEKGLKNEKFEMPEQGFKWNQLGLLAQKFHQEYDNFSFEELLKMFDKLVKKILNLIQSLSNEMLYNLGNFDWCGKYSLGRYIQLNTASPYKNAWIKIKKWKRESEYFD